MAEDRIGSQAAPLGSAAPVSQPVNPLTPELVREVAEKVYRLLLHDLQIERERLRVGNRAVHPGRGGGR